MAHLQDNKGSFWGKVRSSTNKISSSLANLSLRSEHDGDSPNSTLIHTALVNHYINKNEQFPSWLGEEQHEQPNQQQRQQQQQNQASSSHSQEQIRQPVPTQRFQPQQSHQHQAGTSRFASRFQQEQQRQQTQQQKQSQSNQSPQLLSRFGSTTDNSSAGSRFSGNGHGLPGGGPQRTDSSSGNAMKDRLKRNNYRSNFNV